MPISTTAVEKRMEHHQEKRKNKAKLKIEPPLDPTMPLLGIYPSEMKLVYMKKTYTPHYCNTIHNSHKKDKTVSTK